MQYSIVRNLEVKDAGLRIDAEYWHPDFIRNSALVSPQNRVRDFVISDVSNVKSSPIDRGFRYLEIANISTDSCAYETVQVTQGEEPDRAHHILERRDVVVSTVRPNRNAVAFIKEDGIIGSSGLAVLRANGVEAEYLFAFCKTDYFTKCLVRASKATMYPAVSTADILDTPLFVPSSQFESLIAGLVQDSLLSIDNAKEVYSQAETQLLSEVGLIEWRPEHQLTFIVNYSDMQSAGRMDADYFQPKYGEIVDAIKGYAGGWDTLGNLVTMERCIEVGSGEYLEEGIPFIRVSNLSPFDITEEKYISESLYEEIKQHQPEQGEILFSKDATPGIAYYLDEPPRKMIPAGGVLKLKSKTDKINNECLTLALNSMLTKEQANRDVGGSVIMHWRPEQIAEVAIPILSEATQTQIRQKITESVNLRRQSKRLLKRAKEAVEMAIEQDEATALAWLERETGYY